MRRLLKKKRIPVYNGHHREGLRRAARFNAQLMDSLRPHVREGVSTQTLDEMAYEYVTSHGHTPACLGYRGYPKTICSSVNNVVCHGIPDERPLQSGEIVNIDLTTIVDGWFGDQSETFLIGEVSPAARLLTQATFDAMWIGIRTIEPYSRVLEIGQAIARFAAINGYGVVERYQGHGLGRAFHQEPGIPHYPVRKSFHDILEPGVCFTIEPMLNDGDKETSPPLPDGWTVLTADGGLSAQFEHTILMTEEGPEVLTLTANGPQEGHQF